MYFRFIKSNKMKKFKIQDNAGNRFTVYAKNRAEAREQAKKQAKGNLIYIID